MTNPPSKTLNEIFNSHEGRRIDKWIHYLEIYTKHFEAYRGRKFTFVEIGISQGGSLQMWRKYFGPQARIIGIDIDERCRVMEEEGFEVFIGSQEDPKFWQTFLAEIGEIDILLDDGGHRMQQQIVTFNQIYPSVKLGGIYLCEDVHTSYWIKYGGGVRRNGTFIELTKNLIDQLQGYHSQQASRLSTTTFTKTTKSIHIYDSVIVIEKGDHPKPTTKVVGTESFYREGWHGIKDESLTSMVKRQVLHVSNSVLRFFRLSGFKWK